MKTIAILWILFVGFTLGSHSAEAAKFISIKNNKALIDLEDENLSVGTMLMARDAAGKRKAVLEIQQIKGGRAIAVLKKGAVQQSYSLEVYGSPSAGSTAAVSGGRSKIGKSTVGVLAGYAMNTMTVKFSSSTAELSGSSFNLSGFYRRELDDKIFVRGLAGYETLAAKNDAYNVEIAYLGLQAQIEYQFIRTSKFDFWAGGGLGFLYAMSKQSNVLDTSKISTNQTLIGLLGMNYRLNNESSIPVQFSYSIFPDNQTSSASQMILRAGYAWEF